MTSLVLPIDHTNDFKWRGNPFSVTETIKILTRIDSYLKMNIANAAILCVGDHECYQYALIIGQIYMYFGCYAVGSEGRR